MQILFDILRGNYYRTENQVKSNLSLTQNVDKKQSPQVLWIGCSDIYLASHLATGLEPGEVILHHNIANQIKQEDTSVQSIIQYAIESLKVKKIVVCGHYHCSSIGAALRTIEVDPTMETPMSQWMQELRELVFQHWSTLRAIISWKDRVNRLAELNLLAQVAKLRQNEFVKMPLSRVQIIAWMFDAEKGTFTDLTSRQVVRTIAVSK